MTKPFDIVVLYNEPALPPGHANYESEAGVLKSVGATSTALRAAGYNVKSLGAGKRVDILIEHLHALRPDAVVNLCESFAGDSKSEPYIAALLDLLRIPYSGSPPQCLAITHDKAQTKRLLSGSGIATPDFVEICPGDEPDERKLRRLLDGGPLIIKPAAEDASLGISAESVVTDWPAAQRQMGLVHEQYGSALIERYIAGREFNVGIIELPELQVLPIAEIEFQASPELPWPIVTYDGKWSTTSDQCRATPVCCPAKLQPELAQRLQNTALAAYRFTGCRDYARIDLRADDADNVFVLEVNANPDIGPSAGLARMLGAAGISHDDFARRLVKMVLDRRAVDAPVHSIGQASQPRLATIRPLQAAEIPLLIEMTRATGVFRPDEIEIAGELLREADRDGSGGHYQVLVAEMENRPVGWSCHGRVPLTDATFDLYWIVVDRQTQGRGIGRQLLDQVEHRIKAAGGRWLLAETSSTTAYAATREFYRQCGYRMVSQIDDYYRAADGKATFGKKIDRA